MAKTYLKPFEFMYDAIIPRMFLLPGLYKRVNRIGCIGQSVVGGTLFEGNRLSACEFSPSDSFPVGTNVQATDSSTPPTCEDRDVFDGF